MAALPKRNTTVDQIYRSYEQQKGANEPRGHLGASMIGDRCSRKLFNSFRWVLAPNFSGRVLRLFERGQNEEAILVSNLRAIGVEVWECDPTTGGQFRMSEVGGHFAGSTDGICKGVPEAPKTPHILEFKTVNKKGFDRLCKAGVETDQPRHFAQMQVYMKGFKLTRALYLSVCKDDDRIYMERINYDAKKAKALIGKAENIITAPQPSDCAKVSERPDWYECKFCDYSEVCHQEKIPEVNCRTCAHSTPEIDRDKPTWTCAKHDKEITESEQRTGCDQHVFIPGFIPGEMIGASEKDNSITYKLPDGREIVNCEQPGDNHYTSTELHVMDLKMANDPAATDIRNAFNAMFIA